MVTITGWLAKAGIFRNEGPKSPWGSGGSGRGDGGSGGNDGGGGPRNPWAFPPEGRRSRPGAASTLDEILKRARSGGGPGIPGLPGGMGMWWLIGGVLVLLWVVLTSFWQIGPQQRGVVTTLGRYTGTLDPGWQVTLPAPFQSVKKIDVSAMRTEDFPKGSGENLMLTGDKNIVDLAYSVRWNVKSPSDYVFQINDPDATVAAVAESAMRAVVATATLNDTIGAGRTGIESRVRDLMQQILDEYEAGVSVQGIAIKNASAPQAVDEDFKKVSAAQQQAAASINQANAYYQQVIAGAQGSAAEFDKIYEQYKLAPDVTRRRMYYETMEQVLAKTKKTIVDAPGVTPFLPLAEAARRSAAQSDGSIQVQAPSPAPQQPQQGQGGSR